MRFSLEKSVLATCPLVPANVMMVVDYIVDTPGDGSYYYNPKLMVLRREGCRYMQQVSQLFPAIAKFGQLLFAEEEKDASSLHSPLTPAGHVDDTKTSPNGSFSWDGLTSWATAEGGHRLSSGLSDYTVWPTESIEAQFNHASEDGPLPARRGATCLPARGGDDIFASQVKKDTGQVRHIHMRRRTGDKIYAYNMYRYVLHSPDLIKLIVIVSSLS